ncbi:SIR2 family protein [Arthrobacter sp. SLBN-122]|uniref:SIR2 family protein n=1 Tax=Arthrobacter sp. SLBN-122 TaxID=2768455 RepID=UPI001150F252|nr:SIR2 family protein [Arthrobacter sp. SLBN-122]TQJ33049.1 SIR2-like protein [Arthrobacter sp. SLBN-122]
MVSEWLTNEVAVPRRLLDALNDDRLVVFAGAGISIPAPTRLPGFEALARALAANAGYPHVLDDPSKIDAFLGRVEDYSGGNVHRMAEELLAPHGRRGNRLHNLIIELSATASLRVVTTNFDPYLSRAAKRARLRNREFVGPAVPLGHSFSGLVYLHGKFPLADNDSVVLTDRDFGEAYVTGGWATRFLTSMFSTYTVLFVGYSGTDTVMRYLTRSLPPAGIEHFAFVPTSELDKWEGLGVTPIPFPIERRFAALPEALDAWKNSVSTTHIGRLEKISRIVEQGPSLSALDESYLSSAFMRVETLQHFLAVADPSVWLRWCAERGDLDDLWKKSVERGTDEAYAWAEWCGRSVEGSDPLLLFRVIHQHGGGVADALWSAIWRTLITEYPQPHVAGPYLSVLLQGASRSRRLELSLLLLQAASSDREGAMRLLEWAVTPTPAFEKSMWSLSEDYDVRIDFDVNGDRHHAKVAWQRLLPLSSSESSAMMMICIGLLTSSSGASRHFSGRPLDPISTGRAAIEPHNQDQYGDRCQLLIDVARESVRGQAELWQQEFLPVLRWMLQSSSTVVQRLALDALHHFHSMQVDTAVRLVLDHKLLFDHRVKHEVFRLLAAFYPKASKSTKEALLKIASQSHAVAPDVPSDYERYNLLVWLSKLDASDEATRKALERIQEENPAFEPRENPDFESFFFEFGTGEKAEKAPVSGRLSKESAESIIQEVRGFNEEFPQEWLQELAEAASSAPRIEKLLRGLGESNLWSEELWDILLPALEKCAAPGDMAGLLEVLANHPSRTRYLYSLESLISKAWSDKAPQKVDDVKPVLAALYKLWQSVGAASEPEGDQEPDAYSSARSSARGRLALHYLQGMGVLARIAPETPVLAGEIRGVIESMIGNERDLHTVTILAGSTGWFFSEYEDWADNKLLPLFDWTLSPEVAAATWSGFLNGSSWSSHTVEKLSESVRSGYSWVSRYIPEAMPAFVDHHSFLFSSGLLPDNDPTWVDAFTLAATVEERELWIDSVSRRYGDTGPSPEAWRRLLTYWARRARNTPIGLDGIEVNALLQWLFLTETSLPEALAVLLSSPIPRAPDEGSRINFDYNKLPVTQYPAECGKVLTRVLQGCAVGAWLGQGLEPIVRHLGRSGARAEALSVVNELVRLGVAGAIGWLDPTAEGSAAL